VQLVAGTSRDKRHLLDKQEEFQIVNDFATHGQS
jgi:hypothetical protein